MAETEEMFGNRLAESVTQGFLCLALSLGHRTGLFETMAGLDEPKTAKEIAQTAGLKERYVREWLGAMVAGYVVEVDEETSELFSLPPHRRAAVTRLGDIVDWSMVAQGLPALAGVHEKVADCMRVDGPSGIPGTEYTPSYRSWRDQCYETFVQTSLLEAMVPSIPGLEAILEKETEVLEINSHTGSAARKLARAYPESRFHLCNVARPGAPPAGQLSPAVNSGAAGPPSRPASAGTSPYRQFNLTSGDHDDPAGLPADWSDRFGLVLALQCVRDAPRPDALAFEARRVLRAGGLFALTESNTRSRVADNRDNPTAVFVYTSSLFGSLPLSLGGSTGARDGGGGGGGLGIGAAYGRESFKPLLESAGFASVKLVPVPGDPLDSVTYVCKK